MIIKAIAVSALAACPPVPGQLPTVQMFVERAAPACHSSELPEQHEPEHPADDDPSPIYRGLVYQSISNNASTLVTFNASSGASGGPVFGLHVPQSIWPENTLTIVSSVGDLEVSERLKPQFSNLNVSPNASKHMANPSTIQIRRSITRRQR